MIVVSLLLILVAVTLLVLGLTGGSSGLLISSIVASLLAAVFLVIGARQAAAARRAAGSTPTEPFLPDYAERPDYADENSVFVAEPEFAAAAEETARRRQERLTEDLPPRDDAFAADSGTTRAADDQRETVQFDPGDLAAARPSAGPDLGEASYADQSGAAPAGDLSADAAHDPLASGADTPDYDRATTAINAARSEDAWRGETSADADEFAEPDSDDPDDEPLPQAVQPADAVRVARLDADVLVVDGRPRYHLAECPSLVGRLAEPIPVGEAVELGFSPCGLCRPVDHLVAAATRR